MFNFVFDREHLGRPYPNLAPMMDASNGYHGMGDDYPYIGPCRLLYYAQDHNYPVNIVYTNQLIPPNSYYPIGISWFNFEYDYLAQLTNQVKDLLRNQRLKLLFYYHEGDNPFHEKIRLDNLCVEHNLPTDCYRFISGNTQADAIDNFIYFPDHELFYWRNAVVWNGHLMPECRAHKNPRAHKFTALSRVHKWWRATVMSMLHREHLLDESYWSYNTVDVGDRYTDNPIELWPFDLEDYMNNFIAGAPYSCDSLSDQDHNSHWTLVHEHYEDSYCNLVLETFFDADGSNGTFISEKTFKPIRHAQPFVVFGTPGTLSTLRSLGYRCFDHVLDNSYDTINNNTERFKRVVEVVKHLNSIDLDQWYKQCYDDIIHNQQLFVSSKYERLNILHDKLTY